MSQGEERDEEEEDEDEDDDSVSDGEPIDQTRPPVLARLLLALAGNGVFRHDFICNGVSGSGGFSVWFWAFSVRVPWRKGTEYSEKESSTK